MCMCCLSLSVSPDAPLFVARGASSDPKNTHLQRIKDWLLLKINKKSRAKPSNDWQAGCPDVVPGHLGIVRGRALRSYSIVVSM